MVDYVIYKSYSFYFQVIRLFYSVLIKERIRCVFNLDICID